ncbi:phospholipase D family protein [Salipaludibacillus agaradhaerens]|uniref:phospholipase D-like domain-containing protein n=1 Tax=Salipaludibacillus agaradhaerens TaxID=76935 RepID=UPI000996E9EE|nr:phospholipase D family protein [Salipaludibacillus agaradhaerens]MCR6105939.1 phospholipase D family protein [Salipaludibacillus agaradhaerens]MCR6117972.1 phospholipase D family protein [Salipaludibacillus agaradhaerens]
MKHMYWKNVKRSLFLYIMFSLLTAGFMFHYFPSYPQAENEGMANKMLMAGEKVVIIEDNEQAGFVRLDLLKKAEERLAITYHTFHAGVWTDAFMGAVFETADRGVEVEILFDGMLHNMRGDLRVIPYMLSTHPNITLKYYEPFNPLRPYTWHNRMHDKLLIVDDHYVMTGGRNIGDKYFKSDVDDTVYDRDIILIKEETARDDQRSAITEMSQYFDELFNHDYSYEPIFVPSLYRERAATEKKVMLHEAHDTFEKVVHLNVGEWEEEAIQVKGIQIWHNPIERMNHSPAIWQNLMSLIKDAEESVLIQSPYVIPTDVMTSPFQQKITDAVQLDVLTNSKKVTPNLLAYSGYERYRENLAENGVDLYEYAGQGSIHGKTFIIDSYYSVIGSFNVDPRSAFLNTETVIVLEGEEFASALEGHITNLQADTHLVTKDNIQEIDENEGVSFFKRAVLRLLASFVPFIESLL